MGEMVCQNGCMASKARLYPPVAAARKLGVEYTTLNGWRKMGCPAHERVSRMRGWLYNLEEVRAWLQARRAAANEGKETSR